MVRFRYIFIVISTIFLVERSLLLSQTSKPNERHLTEKTDGQISGTVFNDLNGDSVWNQPEEPSLSGWELIATKGMNEKRDTTDNDGNYLFSIAEEDSGTWTISITQQANWIITAPLNGNYILEVTNGLIPNQNFGLFQYGSISGVTFRDANANGIKDISENGLQNWWIKISGNGNDSVLTDESGVYSFDSLLAGTYTISEVQQNDWVQTVPNSPEEYSINIASGAASINNDFGNYQYSSIEGVAYRDNNGNGTKEISEDGLQNWKIYISGPLNDSVLTDENGNFSFDSLLAGTYTISQELLPSWIQLTPVLQGNYSLEITSGTSSNNNNFGNFQYGSISGMMFLDANANGIKDISENGLQNWWIKISGNGNDSVLTDESGVYSFDSLLAG
ncbi:MAG: hypothetical protein FJ218_08080, partial [Ignavibacteria bacterium]|nr:hypothetical protein [Ignavibacteria bacterium]